MNLDNLLVSDLDGIRTVTLNRPGSLNAITYDVLEELEEVIRDCKYNEKVRVIVLKGAGKAFCAGDDLKGMGTAKTPLPEGLPLKRAEIGYSRFILTLRQLDKPVLAQVHGFALGAGCDLAFSCDMIFAAKETKFGLVFAKRGALGGTAVLPKIIGYQKACELLFSGDMFTAEEAHQMGIVNYVASQEEIDELVNKWAHRFAKAPTGQIGMMKKAINQSIGESLERSVDYQRYIQALMYNTHDSNEGVSAFLEKREPHFIGK
ncbi:enoyl-CoA hydratase/isomerase family protein [Peribacillus cavernae]|uniref:Enoyl-CoA hydratase/isomerase family protein n=1 Tax=Peribacillus cavernae TaxID=1674310 RepID=A0A3S0VQQ3_9BACI|nr:enoyl-CoA hydratase/isomerase family protein [Peribacillus cavernae]MDQ0218031.1 enoyl-CoA hydratase/carnithine racemase [Peribacillus cavernae]RUQ32803.1 enoyl-CoA hydratase/isomerase family protein [Peribacillus cavernae]